MESRVNRSIQYDGTGRNNGTFDYTVTSFKLARWKVRVSSLRRKPIKGTRAGVDINTLTMEQYLALSRENQAPGVVKPKTGGNFNFEIKSQFMPELREDTFSENKNEDVRDHVDRVLNIVSLFNIPEVSQDAVLLRVFPFTLIGSAKRWTAKQLEDIHNFKQESDESLYQAWEWYNDLLYKCPTHDINNHHKSYARRLDFFTLSCEHDVVIIEFRLELVLIAALAVLITGASQSRQHDTLERLPMDIRLEIDLENQSVCQIANGFYDTLTVLSFSKFINSQAGPNRYLVSQAQSHIKSVFDVGLQAGFRSSQ
ncbi:hypothetical protein Tco_1153060 [Tanacetum coccineum]